MSLVVPSNHNIWNRFFLIDVGIYFQKIIRWLIRTTTVREKIYIITQQESRWNENLAGTCVDWIILKAILEAYLPQM